MRATRLAIGFLFCGIFSFILLASSHAADSSVARANQALFPATEFTLTNGLRVFTLEDHHSPLVAVQVWYAVGSADEPEGRRGFAHLFEHMMFRGTDRLGPTDHADLIHGVGGNMNAFTAFDQTCYHETLPAQQLELALWLESERMAFLTVDGNGFMTERKVVEEERRLGLNQPYGELPDKGAPLVFGEHAYGHTPIGNLKDLRLATPDDVHAWWRKWYTPNNATLVIVGDVKTEAVRALCEKYFGWMPSVPREPREIPRLGPFESAQQSMLNLENAPAPAIGLLWRTVPEGHPDALALELLATIVGGGESSRVYRKLVADEHLAVMAAAMPFGLRQAGIFAIGAAISPMGGDTAKALAALRTEVDRLQKDGVTEDELTKARNQAASQLVLETEKVEEKASLLGNAIVVGGGLAELNSRFARLHQITREDLQRVARQYLSPEHALTVTVPSSGLMKSLGRLFTSKHQAEEGAPVTFATNTVLRGRPGVVRPADLPAHPPVADGNSPIPTPTLHEQRLSNGLRIIVAPNSETPALEVVLALPFGSWAEQKPGQAAMALTMLSKATAAHEEKALAEELERYAIRLNGLADHDDSRITVTCLAEHAERAFGLIAEVALTPTFPEAPFKIAISQARTGLTIADSDPKAVSERELRRHLFAGHPYGRRTSGESKDLQALKREDLEKFWKTIAHPEQATLIIAGAVTKERGLELAQKFLEGWTNSDNSTACVAPQLPPALGTNHIFLVDWPGAIQSEIRLAGYGIRNDDTDKPIGDLVSSYFGGSFGSRLMKAIRVEKGATYGASGGFRPHRFAGTFELSTFTKTATTAETLRVAMNEMQRVGEQPPSTDELSSQRRFFLGSAAARFETSEQIANQLARLSLNSHPLDYVQRSLNRISSASAADCEALLKRTVSPNQWVIVVVGDADKISKDLKAIAPVTLLDRDGKEKTETVTP